MTDAELEVQIRASIERDADRPFVHYAQRDLRTLLRWLDEARVERDDAVARFHAREERLYEEAKAHSDTCGKLEAVRAELAEVRATLKHREELDAFTKPLSCETHGLVVNLASFGNKCAECQRDALAAESEARHQSCLVLMNSVTQYRARVAALEAALRTVRKIISSDSVEYDDVRNAEQIIDKALEPTQSIPAATSETEGERP